MINKLILNTLKEIGVPVAFQKYGGKLDTYITFHEYLTTGESYSDDLESHIAHYIQVDVWSKRDYTVLVNDVKNNLSMVGLKRIDETDLYEIDTKIYHKGLRFYYLEESEEN